MIFFIQSVEARIITKSAFGGSTGQRVSFFDVLTGECHALFGDILVYRYMKFRTEFMCNGRGRNI